MGGAHPPYPVFSIDGTHIFLYTVFQTNNYLAKLNAKPTQETPPLPFYFTGQKILYINFKLALTTWHINIKCLECPSNESQPYKLRNFGADMPLHVTPQSGIPLPDDFDSEDPKTFSTKVKVAAKTIDVLLDAGAQIPISTQEKDAAVDIFQAFTDPEHKEKPAESGKALSTPATVVYLRELIRDYDHQVIDEAVQLRRFITNKLIEETTKDNATNRIKALELLGKMSDVGLFTEKTEITVKNAPIEDLESQIRSKIFKILGHSKAIDASFEVIEKEMGTLTPEDLTPT